ncbi:MAG: type II toxin-antitoxin system VapC family toxin [Alphaproteobacteria bacterium]|nr:type II toxin-antitoxin system VapC family toxin [Alphaproteobacteria bacterium]
MGDLEQHFGFLARDVIGGRQLGEPLMFKGADFPQTDIEAA